MTLRVAVVSGGRADYGLLSAPLKRLVADKRFALRLIVTGQHLAPGSGTLGEIEAEGLHIDDKVDILLAADTALAVCKAMGLAIIGLAESLERQQPHILLLLGDRYEIFAAAQAAHILRLPIAHIAGGDVTDGAVDDALRHGITKFASLHFVTTQVAAQRVRQLGENPARIYVVGSPGLDRIATTEIPDRAAFFSEIKTKPFEYNIVVTFHPVTARRQSMHDISELLAALDTLGQNVGLLFTGVNADTEGRTLEQAISAYCATRTNASLHGALGTRHYFAALTHCDMVVGNSSSGLYEAPSFHIPTVNIGDRQAGRIKAASVIDCPPERKAIMSAIKRAFRLDCCSVVNPYGDGHAAERIVEVLAKVNDPRALLVKSFCDLKTQ